MMSIDFKVNGCLIGHVYATNSHPGDIDSRYKYEFHRIGANEVGYKSVITGELDHQWSHGYVKLAHKILSDILAQGEKERRK